MIGSVKRLFSSKEKTPDVRSFKAKKNIFFMLGIKGGSVLINFMMVSLVINYLDEYRYGIWLTLTSVVVMLSVCDVGIAHGLRNKFATSMALGDVTSAKKYVSTTYSILSIIAVSIFALLFIISYFISWDKFLNAPSSMAVELALLVRMMLFLFFSQMIVRILSAILIADQKPFLSSFIDLFTSLIVFILIYTNCFTLTLLNLGGIIMGIPVLVWTIASVYFFFFNKRYAKVRPDIKYIEKSYAKDLVDLGLKFFVIQLTAIFMLQSNNLIIIHAEGASAVTEFNIVYKYMGIPAILFGIVVTPFWSAITDAYAKNDINWIKKTIMNLNKIWLGIVALSFVFLLCANIAYSLWIGDQIQIPLLTNFLALIYYALSMRCAIYCSFINGVGKVRLQMYVTTILSLVHVPFCFLLAKYIGINGVFLSLIIVTFINSVWEPIQYKRIINNRAQGVWGK